MWHVMMISVAVIVSLTAHGIDVAKHLPTSSSLDSQLATQDAIRYACYLLLEEYDFHHYTLGNCCGQLEECPLPQRKMVKLVVSQTECH